MFGTYASYEHAILIAAMEYGDSWFHKVSISLIPVVVVLSDGKEAFEDEWQVCPVISWSLK